MKLAIVGGRDFADYARLQFTIERHYLRERISAIISAAMRKKTASPSPNTSRTGNWAGGRALSATGKSSAPATR